MSASQYRRSNLRDWAELVRVPNTPTVIADVVAAAVLVVGGCQDGITDRSGWDATMIAAVAMASIAAVALYWAGMIYNDVADVAADRASGRSRPLVDGRVSMTAARTSVMALFGLGLIGSIVAGSIASGGSQWTPPLAVAGALAILIYLYDGPLKRLPIAPLLMGGCRTGSFLLGGVTALVAASPNPQFLGQSHAGLPAVLWAFAISMGVYITGLTTFARRESTGERSTHLIAGLIVMVLGIAGLAWSPHLADGPPPWRIDTRIVFPLAIVLVTGGTLFKAVVAIRQPSPRSIGQTIGSGITAIIPIAAVIAMMAGGPLPALAIAALMVPVLGLRRRYAQT